MSQLLADFHHRFLAGAAPKDDDNKASGGERLGALLIIVFFAFLGGYCVKLLSVGQKWNGEYKIKPVFPKKFQIPPLVGMLLIGCIARNIFEANVPKVYFEPMADWVR